MGKYYSQFFQITILLFITALSSFNLLSCVPSSHQQTRTNTTNEENSQCEIVSERIPSVLNNTTNQFEFVPLLMRQQIIVPFIPYQTRRYIPVTLHYSIGYREQESIIEAMRFWNRILNKRILRIEQRRTRNDIGTIHVTMKDLSNDEDSCNRNFYAITTRFNSPGEDSIVKAVIEIDHDDTIPDLDKVMIHEFGHAFGLRHDLNPTSIMFPVVAATDWELEQEDISFVLRVIQNIPGD